MSGKHISDRQVNLYMTQRVKYGQIISAAKSGISERTASRIDNGIHQPHLANRTWRTRAYYKNLDLGRQIYDLICLFWSLVPWKEKQSMILLES